MWVYVVHTARSLRGHVSLLEYSAEYPCCFRVFNDRIVGTFGVSGLFVITQECSGQSSSVYRQMVPQVGTVQHCVAQL